jgi:hypothetical protein
MPSSGLWEQAEPGWRTAADMQRVEAWRAETNDRREGIGSPDALRTSVNYWTLPAVPQGLLRDEDPVQFELEDNDPGLFLDKFRDRPVGELFVITSLWIWGRIKETARMEWSWIQDDYVVIPRSKAKKGRGKVARLPPAIRERLEAIRYPKSPYVFARWVEDVRRFAGHPTRIQPFDPNRMVGQMEK